MKVTIYRSKYDWEETILNLGLEKFLDEADEAIKVGTYYTLKSFSIEQSDSFHDGNLTKVTVLPIVKKKNRELTEKQKTLDNFVNQYDDSYARFSPEKGGNLDTILLVKQQLAVEQKVYLIPFGQGYRKVEEVADPNFGIEFAERGVRHTDVITKHVNYFGQDKSQSITNYRRTSRDIALPSEAYTSITAYPDRRDMYGDVVVCALGVTLQVKSNKKVGFGKGLCEVVRNIDDLMRSKTTLSKFPKIQYIDDKNTSNTLNLRLTDIIKAGANSLSDAIVQVPDALNRKTTVNFKQSVSLLFLANIANNVVFLDKMELSIFIIGLKRKTMATIDLSGKVGVLSQIGKYLKINSSYAVDQLMFKCVDAVTGDSFDYHVEQFILAEICNNNKPYMLQNGRWGTFNAEFFSLINESLADIEVHCNEEELLVNFGNQKSKNVKVGSEEDYMNELQAANADKLSKIHKHFAKPSSNNFTYRGPGVELADMYDSVKRELLTMKLGESTATTMYSLEQSILALSIINNEDSYNVTDIMNAIGGKAHWQEALASKDNVLVWIYPIKNSDDKSRFGPKITTSIQKNTFDLTKFGSILVKTKLYEWAQFVNESHQKPIVHFVTPRDMSR